jgi:hypothetical protein
MSVESMSRMWKFTPWMKTLNLGIVGYRLQETRGNA